MILLLGSQLSLDGSTTSLLDAYSDAASSVPQGLVSVSRDILQAGPFEQEAETHILSTRARLPGVHTEIGYGNFQYFSQVPETASHDFFLPSISPVSTGWRGRVEYYPEISRARTY
jgi:hypothetical protein